MARRLMNALPVISKNDNLSGEISTMYREQKRDRINVSAMHHIRYWRPERVRYLPNRYSHPRVMDRVTRTTQKSIVALNVNDVLLIFKNSYSPLGL